MIPGSHIERRGMGVFDEELTWLFNQAKTMDSIIEIGSFIGRSTYALCSGCSGIVYAIDNFQHKSYDKYIENVGHFQNLKTFKKSSIEASVELKDFMVDMVFIDGTHDSISVQTDINLWLPHTKKLICGHDYAPAAAYNGLKQVVNKKFGSQLKLAGSIWYVELGGIING